MDICNSCKTEKCEKCFRCECFPWISIENRMPPTDAYVLIAKYDYRAKVQMHFVEIASRIGDHWYDGRHGDEIIFKNSAVTHWMPLPEVKSIKQYV